MNRETLRAIPYVIPRFVGVGCFVTVIAFVAKAFGA